MHVEFNMTLVYHDVDSTTEAAVESDGYRIAGYLFPDTAWVQD